jgi:hypothetical protein
MGWKMGYFLDLFSWDMLALKLFLYFLGVPYSL